MHKDEVIMQILDSIKVYADIETLSLRAENERLRGLIEEGFFMLQGVLMVSDKEERNNNWEVFKMQNNL